MNIKISLFVSFLALLISMGAPPTWLLKSEVIVVATFALVYGFTAFSPKLPSWMQYQEVRGVTLVALGCAAMFVPAQFIVCSLLVGAGARLVMTADKVKVSLKPSAHSDIVQKQSGQVMRN